MKLFVSGMLLILANLGFAYPVKVHQETLPMVFRLLRNDGKDSVVNTFEPYLTKMQQGLSDTDLKPTIGVISTQHGHHAFNHVGFAKDPHCAGAVAEKYFILAKEQWQEDRELACYHLSIAIHLIQDSFVPFHSVASSNLVGHKAYEDYQLKIIDQAPSREGIYSFSSFVTSDGKTHCDPNSAFGWVDYGAHQSYDSYPQVSSTKDKSHYQEISAPLFQKMIQTLAGFLVFSYEQTKKNEESELIDGYLVGAYSDENNQKYLGIFDGKNLTPITQSDPNVYIFDIAVSPTHDAVAYVSTHHTSNFEVMIMSLPDKTIRLLCLLPASNWSSIAWGTNNKLLVAAGNRGYPYNQIWVVDVPSGQARCLNSLPTYHSFCYTWNENCTKIICVSEAFKFDSADQCYRRLGLFDFHGEPERNLSNPAAHPQGFMEGDPVCLPDGRIIYLFQKDDQLLNCYDLGHCELWQIREDGSERKKLLEFVGNADVHSRPCFGVDRLYFKASDWIDGKYQPFIYSLTFDGQDLQKFSLPTHFTSPVGFLPKSLF